MTSIGEANQVAEEIRQTVRDAEITAGETAKKAKEAEDAAEGALLRIHNAEVSAREAQEAVQEAVESVMGAVEDTRTDLWSLHSARAYSPEVVEEVQEAEIEDGGEEEENVPESVAAVESLAEPEEAAEEETDFKPIHPRRVEIIHEPEADYVVEEPDISASAAFAQLGIFGNRTPAPEEPRGVDIRFAQGKDNGRNSNERILELHKAGKSNMAIAKELGLGLGEVKLVIDLFEGM